MDNMMKDFAKRMNDLIAEAHEAGYYFEFNTLAKEYYEVRANDVVRLYSDDKDFDIDINYILD